MYRGSQNNKRYGNTKVMLLKFFKTMIFSIVFIEMVNGHSCRDEPKCLITRSHGLKTADCYGREFKVFPKCVAADIEVLELSYNRLRRLKKSELSRYSNLGILYLSDNMLQSLEIDTFDNLKYLTVLDLSLNGITIIPAGILQLPSLEKLYLRHNTNMNLDDALEKIKIISSPLNFLDISFTTDENFIPEFPDLRVVPYLKSFNITNNRYSSMKPKHFAGLCKMSILLSGNVSTGFDDPCDCWKINNWLTARNVVFTPFTCPVLNTSCANETVDSDDMMIYEKCMTTFAEMQNSRTLKRVFIGLGSTVFAVVLVLFCLLLIYGKRCFQRSNTNRMSITIRASLLENPDNRAPVNVYV